MHSILTTPKMAEKDVFNSFLVRNATYDGKEEIPRITTSNLLPEKVISFSKAINRKEYDSWIHFYEHDSVFECFWRNPQRYLPIIKQYKGIISPDYSLYYDMPLNMQVWNTYRGKALACWLQENGVEVIPNVRWGDERSFTTVELPEKFAFLGVPKNSIVSIGTYGCIMSRENKEYFRKGLSAMLDELSPEVVLVNGGMPESIFGEFKSRTQFVNYPDWTSTKRRRAV